MDYTKIPIIDYKLKLVWCDITFIPDEIHLPEYIEQDFLV